MTALLTKYLQRLEKQVLVSEVNFVKLHLIKLLIYNPLMSGGKKGHTDLTKPAAKSSRFFKYV